MKKAVEGGNAKGKNKTAQKTVVGKTGSKKPMKTKRRKAGFEPAVWETVKQQVAMNVKFLMDQKHMEYKDLKGVPPSTVYRVRTDKLNINLKSLMRLANDLEVPLHKLVLPNLSKG